ncbi:hypothetical protein T440DRAFT_473759 [Plenodomus tracheiphilus IPT5]|uniref:Uncharacterized protein n=1 Tax=Plenodomus tracheiphilus IPT5 TaxID=1408161 RepID=A0A6A7ANV8_9PLEO|nr:hypothetical protein T440DRAFT_473759 [Plenodomus tracheiphilus IPT5]
MALSRPSAATLPHVSGHTSSGSRQCMARLKKDASRRKPILAPKSTDHPVRRSGRVPRPATKAATSPSRPRPRLLDRITTSHFGWHEPASLSEDECIPRLAPAPTRRSHEGEELRIQRKKTRRSAAAASSLFPLISNPMHAPMKRGLATLGRASRKHRVFSLCDWQTSPIGIGPSTSPRPDP